MNELDKQWHAVGLWANIVDLLKLDMKEREDICGLQKEVWHLGWHVILMNKVDLDIESCI